jgi:hypothetical protein
MESLRAAFWPLSGFSNVTRFTPVDMTLWYDVIDPI